MTFMRMLSLVTPVLGQGTRCPMTICGVQVHLCIAPPTLAILHLLAITPGGLLTRWLWCSLKYIMNAAMSHTTLYFFQLCACLM